VIRLRSGIRLLLLLLLAFFATRSGLPGVALHHLDSRGFMQCCCGCDCAQHPHSADSCLNPLNHHITCGCEKEHRRDYKAPLPRFSVFLLPVPGAVPAPGIGREAPDEPVLAAERRGFPSGASPPH